MFMRLALAVVSTVFLVTRSTQEARPLYSIHDLGPSVRDVGGPGVTIEAMNDAGVLVESAMVDERITHAVGGTSEHVSDLLLPTRATPAAFGTWTARR